MTGGVQHRFDQRLGQKTPRWFLAFDIGGTYTKIALVSTRGEMLDWSAFPTHPPPGSAPLGRLIAELRELQQKAPVAPAGIVGAVAGFLDDAGALLYNPNLPWLEGVAIRAELLRNFSLPVALETDANTACAGEYLFGSGERSRRFLCLTGGTGLGAGMIVDGKLVRAAFGGMGDAGHVIVAPDGPLCSCGGHGCAEVVLSTQTLAEQYSATMGGLLSFRDLVTAAVDAEADAMRLLEHAGRALGIAIASLAHIFFPDRIAIAGGLSEAGEPLLRAAVASFSAHGGKLPVSMAMVVRASAGAHATLLGAVACLLLAETKQTTGRSEQSDFDSSPLFARKGIDWLVDEEGSPPAR